MANSIAYKNVGLGVESSYGSSVGVSYYAPVKSVDLNEDPTFQLKEDTSTTAKGYDRYAYLRNTIEGSVNVNMDALSSRYWLRLGLGGGVTVGDVSPEGGATAMTFLQDTDGTIETYRLDVDRNTAVQSFLGLASQSFEMTSSGDFVEATVNVTAKEDFAGTALTPTGPTIPPFVFAESHVYYGDTTTGCTTEVYVDDWTLTYDMQTEAAHQSGSRNAKRVDPLIPLSSGNWTRFYEDTNYHTYIDNDTTKSLKFSMVSSTNYSGTSPYRLDIYVPRVKITISEKPYEAANMIKETVNFEAIYDSTIGYLYRPVLYNGLTAF